MAKYVPDTFTDRWVIFATQRAFRPHDNDTEDSPSSKVKITKKHGYNYSSNCPFCIGNEQLTPPEIYRWTQHQDELHKNHESDWLIRIIPNKFPISDIHEVVIHHPDHLMGIADLPSEHIEILVKVLHKRFQLLSQKGTVIIFNNKGPRSGESLIHPHSQIITLPRQINLHTLSLQPLNNIIEETTKYVVYCPDFSQWPYEVWISLRKFHEPSFIDNGTAHFGSTTDEELTELAQVLKTILARIETKFPHNSYNYYIHPYSPWYLRIIPRFVERAGFELGTGIYVNIKDPATAARELRDHIQEK